MRIPIYEELILNQYNVEYLREELGKSKLGLIPMYTSLHLISDKERPTAAMNIEQVLKELEIHPRYPYPFYIISETPIRSISITVVEHVQNLPLHYFKKAKRLKNKELALLNKATLLAEKVVNNDLYQKEIDLKEGYTHQVLLYRKSKELNFYENVLEELDQKEIRDGQKK
ncbi:hypothetical protein [Halobacteriovorax sp. HLS]|uniref:hypothetical protein n=1 Tax=Halobacteriovorax sp. HLS TaxID=2234000 RepID=UPI000FDC67D6|nr:hypothetical protein [Halobacteriovorax sp. HLS]